MEQPVYRYKQSVLEELKQYGILPRSTTPPALIREFINDLYRHEIRKLKRQQVELERQQGRPARKGYADKVIALRRKYPLLSLPLEHWVESPSDS